MSVDAIFELMSNGSSLYNAGYWTNNASDLQSAQRNLLICLTKYLGKRGRILDVGCGLGGAASYLSQYYEPNLIHGVDISESAIEFCREWVSMSQFSVMNASKLDFEAQFFDDIISIGSAVYFFSRDAFFSEAFRVLKPGGRIAIFDAIEVTPANTEDLIYDADSYRARLNSAKFSKVMVEDISENVIGPYLQFVNEFVSSLEDTELRNDALVFQQRAHAAMARRKAYVLVFAARN